jgi:hypothetical protein
MARDFRAPNINARRLGKYLQMIREQVVELSYAQAAERLERTPEWLARVETGFEAPSPTEVERILTRYQCRDSSKADLLIDWASRPAGPEWLAAHLDRMPAAERDILTMESEASIIRAYRFRHVPALLQAEPYARFLLPHTRFGNGEVDVDAEWSLLDSRQKHHLGTGHRFLDVIIDEGALKFTLKSVPPDVRAAQMCHLIERDADPFTTIRIVPWNAPITEDRINPFDIFEFPEASDHVTVAYSLAGAEVSRVDGTSTWDQVDRELALPADESRELIRHHLAEIEDT